MIVLCEILHLKSGKIYSIGYEVITDSDEYLQFQESENPEILGYKFERDYIEIESQ